MSRFSSCRGGGEGGTSNLPRTRIGICSGTFLSASIMSSSPGLSEVIRTEIVAEIVPGRSFFENIHRVVGQLSRNWRNSAYFEVRCSDVIKRSSLILGRCYVHVSEKQSFQENCCYLFSF